MTIPVVLASSSPRRKALLNLLGIEPEVVIPNIEEVRREGEAPKAYVERLAREKASVVHRPDALVVAADTTVALDDHILEKPQSEAEAASMLRRLQSRDHVVHTAIAVAYDGNHVSGVESTRVWLMPLDDRSIKDYIATGESMDKAGAYGIQGYGSAMVEKIEGDYFTVMGLGLSRLVRLMTDLGVVYHLGRITRGAPSPAP